MKRKLKTNIERIIAKIDNDFNPDNSDWIPRVAAWAIDAMSQLDVLKINLVRKKLIVKDRIAYSNCPLNDGKLKVYDSKGCELKQADQCVCGCGSSYTGEPVKETHEFTPDTINIQHMDGTDETHVFAETINDKYPYRYNIHNQSNKQHQQLRNYVLADCDKIEINFDDEFIYIETEDIETEYSEAFGYDLPVIPNNGLLIEAITYFCMYKMLCRGYNHPVFNLAASQYGTNPYYIWMQLKEEARRSILNGADDDSSKLFRSTLFVETFDPRN